MTFPYGTTHSDIIGPECAIFFSDPGSSPEMEKTIAIVDSGAEITVILSKYANQLTYNSDSIRLFAANGDGIVCPTKIVDIYLGNERL